MTLNVGKASKRDRKVRRRAQKTSGKALEMEQIKVEKSLQNHGGRMKEVQKTTKANEHGRMVSKSFDTLVYNPRFFQDFINIHPSQFHLSNQPPHLISTISRAYQIEFIRRALVNLVVLSTQTSSFSILPWLQATK